MAMNAPRATAFTRILRRRYQAIRDAIAGRPDEPADEYRSLETGLIPLFERSAKTAGIAVQKPRWGVWAFRVYAVLPFVIAAALLIAPHVLDAPQASLVPEPKAAVSTPTAAPRAAVLPAGSAVTMGRWTFTMGAVQWNQRSEVLAANPYAPSIPSGQGWATLPITVRNASDQMLTPGLFEVVLHAGGKSISQFAVDDGEYRIPGRFTAVSLEPGESLHGNLGFRVADSAASAPDCRIELRVRSMITATPQSQLFSCAAG